jgi:Ala-tRNA(Pro) deacylase
MNVTEFLKERKVGFEMIPHRDTYDAQHLAQALHVPGREVAKTVLLSADHRYRYIVAVLPATKTVDFTKASHLLGGSKLELATESEISQHCPDCELGALPPFGSQYGMRTIVDTSLAEDDEIVFEGNSHHEAVRMKFRDFLGVEQPLVGDFSRA